MINDMDGLCYMIQEIICYIFLWRGDLAIICGVLWCFVVFCGVLWRFAAFCSVLRHFVAFCGILRRFVAFCGILRCFAVFCGVLRCFAAFCSILQHFAAFCSASVIKFWGAQTPTPFSGWLIIIVPKWAGRGPLSPLKTMFLVSSWVTNGTASPGKDTSPSTPISVVCTDPTRTHFRNSSALIIFDSVFLRKRLAELQMQQL